MKDKKRFKGFILVHNFWFSFEISDVYTKCDEKALLQKKLGIIASGRIGNNYEDFSRFINDLYLVPDL